MDLQRYDIVKAKIKYESGSVQSKERPYVVVSNPADQENGLSLYSMGWGEQPFTISKEEVIEKLGTVTDQKERNIINKVCFNTFFYGEQIDWQEVFA